ncbi:MAG: hypothetical protein LBV47_00990 [Bacteroidales bacterium]|jgi:hypothetical protein|nr:hypothetical protein [Bacteroidales bacterium]
MCRNNYTVESIYSSHCHNLTTLTQIYYYYPVINYQLSITQLPIAEKNSLAASSYSPLSTDAHALHISIILMSDSGIQSFIY